MNGIYFDHFMQLFSGYYKDSNDFIDKDVDKINIRCAGITDNDPEIDSFPTQEELSEGKNRCLYLIEELKANSENCRLFSNLKTFEYDLALEGNNLNQLCSILLEYIETDGTLKAKCATYIKEDWSNKKMEEKVEASKWFLERLNNSNPVGKGEFAQALAYKLNKGDVKLKIPEYISDAIIWVTNNNAKVQ
jgi:hypothetical protein